MTGANGNGGRLQWSTLTNVGMLLIVVIGGLWALIFGPVQDRFARNERLITELRDEQREDVKALRANIASMREEMARTHLTRAEFDAWTVERNRILESMSRRLEQMERERK